MAVARKITLPRRGDVVVVDFDPTIGAEIRKTSPALVIQNDIDNRLSPLPIFAVITSQIDDQSYRTEVHLRPPEGGLAEPSTVLLNQIRSVDSRRLTGGLGLRPSSCGPCGDRGRFHGIRRALNSG